MDLFQTKLVGLTMELNLKTIEFNKLCHKLEQIKAKNVDPNDKRLLIVKNLFKKNHNEILEIIKQLRELNKKNINNT